jgi:hypothetical protein
MACISSHVLRFHIHVNPKPSFGTALLRAVFFGLTPIQFNILIHLLEESIEPDIKVLASNLYLLWRRGLVRSPLHEPSLTSAGRAVLEASRYIDLDIDPPNTPKRPLGTVLPMRRRSVCHVTG